MTIGICLLFVIEGGLNIKILRLARFVECGHSAGPKELRLDGVIRVMPSAKYATDQFNDQLKGWFSSIMRLGGVFLSLADIGWSSIRRLAAERQKLQRRIQSSHSSLHIDAQGLKWLSTR